MAFLSLVASMIVSCLGFQPGNVAEPVKAAEEQVKRLEPYEPLVNAIDGKVLWLISGLDPKPARLHLDQGAGFGNAEDVRPGLREAQPAIRQMMELARAEHLEFGEYSSAGTAAAVLRADAVRCWEAADPAGAADRIGAWLGVIHQIAGAKVSIRSGIMNSARIEQSGAIVEMAVSVGDVQFDDRQRGIIQSAIRRLTPGDPVDLRALFSAGWRRDVEFMRSWIAADPSLEDLNRQLNSVKVDPFVLAGSRQSAMRDPRQSYGLWRDRIYVKSREDASKALDAARVACEKVETAWFKGDVNQAQIAAATARKDETGIADRLLYMASSLMERLAAADRAVKDLERSLQRAEPIPLP